MRIWSLILILLPAVGYGASVVDEFRFSRRAWLLTGLPVEPREASNELAARLSNTYKVGMNESELVRILEEQGFEQRLLNDDTIVMTLTRERFFCRRAWRISWQTRLEIIATTPEAFVEPGCK